MGRNCWARRVPLLRHAAGQIGDPQVRHRGTIGGSIAHGDPASDLPAVLLALRATIVARGPGGQREIRVDDFFTGFLETALAADDLLTEIRVPKVAGAGWSFQKFNRRAQDWAIVGVACVRTNGTAGIGLVNMGPTPIRAVAAEQALASGAGPADVAAVADEGTDPPRASTPRPPTAATWPASSFAAISRKPPLDRSRIWSCAAYEPVYFT